MASQPDIGTPPTTEPSPAPTTTTAGTSVTNTPPVTASGTPAPQDPTAIINATQTAAGTATPFTPLLRSATQLYSSMWDGLPPDPSYIQGLVNKGVNLYQMEQMWRSDPAWLQTNAAQQEIEKTYSGVLGDIFGFAPGVGRRGGEGDLSALGSIGRNESFAGRLLKKEKKSATNAQQGGLGALGAAVGQGGTEAVKAATSLLSGESGQPPEGRAGKGPTR